MNPENEPIHPEDLIDCEFCGDKRVSVHGMNIPDEPCRECRPAAYRKWAKANPEGPEIDRLMGVTLKYAFGEVDNSGLRDPISGAGSVVIEPSARSLKVAADLNLLIESLHQRWNHRCKAQAGRAL